MKRAALFVVFACACGSTGKELVSGATPVEPGSSMPQPDSDASTNLPGNSAGANAGAGGTDAGTVHDGGTASSDAGAVSFGDGDVPAWRGSLVAGQWKELTSASMSLAVPSHDPGGGYYGRVDSWNGFAVLGTWAIFAGTGGHSDWAGNDAYRLDLSAEQPAWLILRQPSPTANVVAQTRYYTDNKPTSSHTYYALHADAARHRIFRLGVGSGWGDGSFNSQQVDAFDLVTNDWDAPTTWADLPEAAGYDKAQCSDPRNGNVYVVANTHLLRRNADDASWSTLIAMDGNAAYSAASCVDTTRNRVVFFRNSGTSNGVLVYEIAGNTLTPASLTGPYAANASGPNNAAVYDAASDRYLVKDNSSGNLVIVVDPTTFATSALSTTEGSDVPRSVEIAGVNGLFQLVPSLKGCLYVPTNAANAWFLALE